MAPSTPAPTAERSGPLDGVVVLEVGAFMAAPFATMHLADLGARVLKVENPAGGETARNNAPYIGRDGLSLTRQQADDISLALLDRNRDKLGVTLDLKHPDAHEVLHDLVRASDIMVTNFSPAALTKLGVDYDSIRAIDPSIVYCTISGFGIDSPPERGKAMDTMIQAMSGLMMTSGTLDDGPTRVGRPGEA
jgi:crotonobetainyl-CoA:carnitine CoA-transferase CaiB-like acyl-CoA transferase